MKSPAGSGGSVSAGAETAVGGAHREDDVETDASREIDCAIRRRQDGRRAPAQVAPES